MESNNSATNLPPENPKIPINLDTEFFKNQSRTRIRLPDYINPEIAYLAGALRDGCISKTETRIGTKYYLAFCNTSYEWLDSVLKPLLEKLFDIRIAKPKPDSRPTKYQIRTRKHGIVNFVARLFEHPIGKQINWNTPSWVMDSPDEIKRWYLRGFFDSEGGCSNVIKQQSKYPWQSTFFIGFYCSSNDKECCVLQDVRNLLGEFGIEAKEIKKDLRKVKTGYNTRTNCFYFKITSKKDKLDFIRNIGSSNPGKYHNLVALSRMIVFRG